MSSVRINSLNISQVAIPNHMRIGIKIDASDGSLENPKRSI